MVYAFYVLFPQNWDKEAIAFMMASFMAVLFYTTFTFLNSHEVVVRSRDCWCIVFVIK